MLSILFVIQIIVAVIMVTVILLQHTSSDGLSGLAGGKSNSNSLISSRSSANLLTRTTAILATLFMINSLVMATLVARRSGIAERIIEETSLENQNSQDTTTPPSQTDNTPSVPIAE